MKTVKVLVLTGDGINCENETALAFNQEGAVSTIIHIEDLIENPKMILNYDIFALPGGFSFGDEIGSGQILSLKLKYSLNETLKEFINNKKLIIGICNGFQTLVRLGLLPDPFKERTMALSHNRQGHFINKWVDLNVLNSKCVWTKKLNSVIELPIRHGEGKIVFTGDEKKQSEIYQALLENGQIALSYTSDVNGSYKNIAGVTDPTGRILGLMPHPEAATFNWLNPDGKKKNQDKAFGAMFFKNAIEYCLEDNK